MILRYTPHSIINTVADYYHVQPKEITSGGRKAHIAFARQVAMFLCRKFTSLSLEAIGDVFGNRDHTTVHHAVDGVKQKMLTDHDLVVQLEVLSERLAGGSGNVVQGSTPEETEFNRMVLSAHDATNQAWKLLAAHSPIEEVLAVLLGGNLLALALRVSQMGQKALMKPEAA